MPRLSFIVPVYKPEMPVLEKAIKALLVQSLKKDDCELIFVLDGPDDEALQAIKRLTKKSKYAVKIDEIEHGGACKARNHGATLTAKDTEFYCFFDYDCIIEPDAAMVWLEEFDRNPDIGFVYSGYRFFNPDGILQSEPFDPWLLRVNNYISTCFPLRKALFPGWNESLASLQDWDFWLNVVENKGGKGLFIEGFPWTTRAPSAGSISGEGCTAEKWLERVDAVKKLHNIKDKSVCVCSTTDKDMGIRLAKALDADFREYGPNDKPHRYKTVISVGIDLDFDAIKSSFSVFSKETKNILFWTAESVEFAYSGLSRKALKKYGDFLNGRVTQYCDDREAMRLLKMCGFEVEVLPLPILENSSAQMPENPRFLVETTQNYGIAFQALHKSLPDIRLEVANGVQKLSDYTGLIHFRPDPMLTGVVKRFLIRGKPVISNIQLPHCNYVDDSQDADTFIPHMVNKIRSMANSEQNKECIEYWKSELGIEKLEGVLK